MPVPLPASAAEGMPDPHNPFEMQRVRLARGVSADQPQVLRAIDRAQTDIKVQLRQLTSIVTVAVRKCIRQRRLFRVCSERNCTRLEWRCRTAGGDQRGAADCALRPVRPVRASHHRAAGVGAPGKAATDRCDGQTIAGPAQRAAGGAAGRGGGRVSHYPHLSLSAVCLGGGGLEKLADGS